MSKLKDILLKQELKLKGKSQNDTARVLKKAWHELPSDFTFGERSLFIELAERLLKLYPRDSSTN